MKKVFLVLAFLLFFVVSVQAQVTKKATWESRMTTFGGYLCTNMKETTTDDGHLLNTYYDAQHTFYVIKDYTGDTAWQSCADATERHYQDYYVIPNNGQTAGYWAFTRGAADDFLRTGDTTSKSVVESIAANSSWCTNSAYNAANLPGYELIRENAYCLSAMIDKYRIGDGIDSKMASYVNNAIGHLQIATSTNPAPPYTKAFMMALASEALIRYTLEVQADARVAPAVKAVADALQLRHWNAPTSSWTYQYPADPNDASTGSPAPDLNLLIVPVFGYVYSKGYGSTYKTTGDLAFDAGVDGAYLGTSTNVQGKQFNQNYRWSKDYLDYTGQGFATPTPTATPTVAPTNTPGGPTPTPTPTRTPTPTPTNTPYPISIPDINPGTAGKECQYYLEGRSQYSADGCQIYYLREILNQLRRSAPTPVPAPTATP